MKTYILAKIESFCFRYTALRRWWRMPERNLARTQIRRGLLFWSEWPWWAVLIAYVAMTLSIHNSALLGQLAVGQRNLIWLLQFIYLVPPFVLLFSCACCLHDQSLFLFEGRRLEEILLTPSSPKRYFPALLLAPIAAYCLAIAITDGLGFAITFYKMWHEPWPQVGIIEPAWYNSKFTRAVLWRLQFVVIGFACSMATACGAMSIAAAWSIGHARSVAIFKTMLIATGYYFGIAMLVVVPQLLFRSIGLAFWYFNFVLMIAIGILFWRAGLNRLRGPQIIAKLQQTAESPR